MTDGLTERDRKGILSVLEAFPKISRVVLFGSRAIGTFRGASDLDLALEGDDLKLTDLVTVRSRIGRLELPFEADIVIRSKITSQDVEKHIRDYGRVFYERQNTAARSSEWRTATVAELQSEGALLVEDGNHGEQRPRHEEFAATGVSFIRAADMENGRILFDSASRINELALARIRKGIGKPGDVLLSHKGTVGKVAFAPLGCEPFVCSPQTTFWRVLDEGKIDRTYLFAYLKSRAFTKQLDSLKGETDMADYVSLTTQRTLKVILPPLPEQRAIASVLGALDDKIELNRRMNETLEALAQSLFKSWFVDATQSALPKAWREGKVNELATISRAGINPGEFPDETFDHYSLPAFDEGRTPNPERGDTIMSNKFIVPPGCVMVSKLNPRIPRIWLPDLRGENRAACSTEFLVTTPKPGVSREFLYCLFKDESFVSIFCTMVTGTSGSHQRVKPESLLAMDVSIPPQALIQKFTDAVAPLLKRVSHNIRESRTLAALRDALLPKLLLGELRVPAAAPLAEARA